MYVIAPEINKYGDIHFQKIKNCMQVKKMFISFFFCHHHHPQPLLQHLCVAVVHDVVIYLALFSFREQEKSACVKYQLL